MPKYIDIHAHLDSRFFKENLKEVIDRMVEKEIGAITIGVDYETSKEAIAMAGKYDFIWAGVGLHPADNVNEVFDFDKYLELAKNSKVVCIGECGLDYFREEDEEKKNKQKEIFKKHIEIAVVSNKPLMMHVRPTKGSMDAYQDALSILEEYKNKVGEKLEGNFHFFAGDLSIAKKALSLGFTMSFDGPITFARDYDEVIKFLPLELIMAETDAPFAAPVPYRGGTCEPFMVIEIIKKIAEIKNLPEEEVAQAIVLNAKRVFGI
ncbi:MAG: TatD family hydrolase [Candidatus Paceibacterota bacterium]